MTTQKITNEKLAAQLKGKYWAKNGYERIYLSSYGYNTRKMSTKTYVECEDGTFTVKCFIDCPSQPWAWRKSQQDKIIKSINEKMEMILSNDIYYLANENGEPIELIGESVALSDLTDIFATEEAAKKAAETEKLDNVVVKKMSKKDYNKAIKK